MISSYLKLLPLDIASKTEVVAYSLRRLRTSYLGNCIRVRRDSDDNEQDIGFSGFGLDEASLLSFVGAGSGYVKTWYDQSGNANDATQTTNGNQPRIVDTGTIDTDSGKPCLQLILANDTYLIASDHASLRLTSSATFSIVHNPSTFGESAVGRIVDKDKYGLIFTPTAQYNCFGLTNVASGEGAVAFGSTNITTLSITTGANGANYYKNGVLTNTVNGTTTTLGSSPLYVFNRSDGARQYDGKCSELIIFNTTITSSQRERLEQNQAKYYGLSI